MSAEENDISFCAISKKSEPRTEINLCFFLRLSLYHTTFYYFRFSFPTAHVVYIKFIFYFDSYVYFILLLFSCVQCERRNCVPKKIKIQPLIFDATKVKFTFTVSRKCVGRLGCVSSFCLVAVGCNYESRLLKI
jgi:hypothetical protein